MDKEPDKKPGFFERIAGNKQKLTVEEELRGIFEQMPELDDDEKRMIFEIIDLGDTHVGEICTPRVDIMLVQNDDTVRTALERMRGTGYSRLPVCKEGADEIVGIVNYKDLIGPLMDGSDDEPVSKHMYDPMFVPEMKDVIPLLGEMQAAHQQMAIVVDEYGGCGGIITIEDILEEIVGEIADESDVQGALIAEIDPGVWRVDGRFSVEDAEELGWPVTESDDYETIAGWLISTLDSVPDAGDVIEVDGYRFTIEKMRRSRISIIKVEALSAPISEE